MKKYTYRAIVYIDVIAKDEDSALEMAENELNIEPYKITLYEVDDDDHEWEEADRVYDERHL